MKFRTININKVSSHTLLLHLLLLLFHRNNNVILKEIKHFSFVSHLMNFP